MADDWDQFKRAESGDWDQFAKADAPAEQSFPQKLGKGVLNAAAGALRGAGSIGATLLAPIDMASDALAGKGLSLASNRQRRADMTGALENMGADTESLPFQAGKLGTEVAGTLGVGSAIAPAARALPMLQQAIQSGGMAVRGGGVLTNSLARAAGGAIAGGAAAGLVDPESAATGAVVGGVLPGALLVAGAAGKLIGKAIPKASPEVAALADRAKQLGIDIPADRLVNSKPMDALASGLNYVPMSGRAATEAKMAEQLNRAGSRLIGQDTSNMAQALRKADIDLGGKFESTLRNRGVAFDEQLLNDVTDVFNTAERELGSDALKAISSQLDELVTKGSTGTIDGNAAYNIKRTLDRIGRRNSPEAFHALELKGRLMDALNRSLGPEDASAFAQTRQQYGNMLALEKIAKNGVEGEISVPRLANMRNINNEPLQELADIAAQFVKPREGQHGAMQRGMVALGLGATTGPAGLAATAAGGRVLNSALKSQAAKNLLLGNSQPMISPEIQQYLARSAPAAIAGFNGQ